MLYARIQGGYKPLRRLSVTLFSVCLLREISQSSSTSGTWVERYRPTIIIYYRVRVWQMIACGTSMSMLCSLKMSAILLVSVVKQPSSVM